MSENDIRVWRENATSPEELTNEALVRRALKRSYFEGWGVHKHGAGSERTERSHELVLRDKEELLKRLGE